MEYQLFSKPIVLTTTEAKKITAPELIEHAEVHVEDENHENIQPIISLDFLDPRKINEVQMIPVSVQVDRTHTKEVGNLNVKIIKSNHTIIKILTGVLGAAIVIGAISMFHQHYVNQQQAATNAQTSSALTQQASTNQQQTVDIQELKSQVAQLKQAVSDYKANQNQDQLSQQLNDLKDQLQQEKANNAATQALLNKLINVIEKIQSSDPQEIDNILQKYNLN